MNTTAILKAPDRSDGGRFVPRYDGPDGSDGSDDSYRFGVPASIGLWVFIAVASSLFTLFIAAYIMRMDATDWSPIAMPQQLWLSTSLLLAGSILMQLAATPSMPTRPFLLGGGIAAIAFLGAQLWAWQSLTAMHVMPVGNPAASFFYLLTAMHGLHVIGGIVAWAWAMALLKNGSAADIRRRVGLCARYWHFLFLVWIVLYATFTGLTPEFVAAICGR